MVKNKVLTPVLAGVLGLSIVGSGLGYYFVNKDSNDGKTEGGKAKLTQVADNINNTLGTAEKAIKGELDFAYNATATVSFGEGFTEKAGVSIQPISVTTVTKQKGSNTAADVSLTYGGNNLVSANAVYSRDNKSAYVQIPELSDAYLMVNVDSLKDKIGSELSSQGIDLDSLFDSAEGADVDFDTDALEKDLEEYKKVMEDSFPKPVDGEKKTGDIDGNEYSYTTKEYTISGNDVKAAFKAVLDKAKDDATLKDMFNKAGVADKLGMSYDEIISQYADSMDSLFASDNLDETVKFDAYYSGDDLVGFSFEKDGEGATLYTILKDDVVAVDFSLDMGSEGSASFKGSANTVDGVTNGKFTMKMETASDSDIDADKTSADGGLSLEPTMAVSPSINFDTMEAEVTLKDLKEEGDAFSGTIRFDVNGTSDSQAVSGWVELASASTADKLDLSVEFGMNGKQFVTMAVTGNKTEASDITVPSGDKIYDITNDDQMNTYLAGCDSDGFVANVKKVLGDEVYNMLVNAEGDLESDYDDYGDYDDYDDYDLSDIDMSDYDLSANA